MDNSPRNSEDSDSLGEEWAECREKSRAEAERQFQQARLEAQQGFGELKKKLKDQKKQGMAELMAAMNQLLDQNRTQMATMERLEGNIDRMEGEIKGELKSLKEKCDAMERSLQTVEKTLLKNSPGEKNGAADIALIDLPNEALSHAASFLPRPSRALFAIALAGQNRSNDISNAILGLSGEQWDILDFGEDEKVLASKITDNLLEAMLTLIGADTKLRVLKLTGCVNVTGAGLNPLRGSRVLEKIDLSLDIDPKPLISCEQVLPILDSIIERDNTALRSTLFPKSWRETEVGNTLLNGFNVRCLQMCDREEVVEFEFDGLKCHIVDGTPAIEI